MENLGDKVAEIARHLKGWRVIPVDVDNRIYHPQLQHDDSRARIVCYREKGDRARFSYSYSCPDCTVTLSRPAKSIAGDLLRKLTEHAIAAHRERIAKENDRSAKSERMIQSISALERIGFKPNYCGTGENRLYCEIAEIKGYTQNPEDWKITMHGLSTDEVFRVVFEIRKMRGKL